MNGARYIIFTVWTVFVLFALGCGGTPAYGDEKVAPIDTRAGIDKIDLCSAIPASLIEGVIGAKLKTSAERFSFGDAPGSSGCAYDAGKDSGGAALFGYAVIAPATAFDGVKGDKTAVNGVGKSAFFVNGADARQLWVKAEDRATVIVAFGDRPNEKGAIELARRIVAAIK